MTNSPMSNANHQQDRRDNLTRAKDNFEKGFVAYEEQKVGPVQYHLTLTQPADTLPLFDIQRKERDLAMLLGIGKIAFELVTALYCKLKLYSSKQVFVLLIIDRARANISRPGHRCPDDRRDYHSAQRNHGRGKPGSHLVRTKSERELSLG